MLVDTFEGEVKRRSIASDGNTKLAAVLPLLKQKLMSESTINTTNLLSRVDTMIADITTPADVITRISYFIDNATNILTKDVEDGSRRRFFALMSRFASNIAMLTNEQLTSAIKEAFTSKATAVGSKISTGSATENERGIMSRLQTAMTTAGNKDTIYVTRSASSTTSAGNVVHRSSGTAHNVVRSRFFATPVRRYGTR